MLAMFQSCTCANRNDAIKIDGSSTVYLITEAIAEEYKMYADARISIGVSGTGGGFKKFCSDRVHIIGASRAITDGEKDLCKSNSVEYIELPVAYDGIVVVVNNENDWINEIKISTLKKIFAPESEGKIMNWSDIEPGWPARKFEIFAPGISSGTYDFFTDAVIGQRHSSRGDIISSEDDNVLVQGVSSTKDSIGFFSFAYYSENKADLKMLPVIDDTHQRTTSVSPTVDTIRYGTYSPLSRPVYIYVSKKLDAASSKFIDFYLRHSQEVAKDVGFVPLTDRAQRLASQAFTHLP